MEEQEEGGKEKERNENDNDNGEKKKKNACGEERNLVCCLSTLCNLRPTHLRAPQFDLERAPSGQPKL